MLAALKTADVALYLGLYATALATLTGLWSLFRDLFLERSRIVVKASDAYRVDDPYGGHLLVKGDDQLAKMGGTPGVTVEVLELKIRNKGRRAAHIETVAQRAPVRDDVGSFLYNDLLRQIPIDL